MKKRIATESREKTKQQDEKPANKEKENKKKKVRKRKKEKETSRSDVKLVYLPVLGTSRVVAFLSCVFSSATFFSEGGCCGFSFFLKRTVHHTTRRSARGSIQTDRHSHTQEEQQTGKEKKKKKEHKTRTELTRTTEKQKKKQNPISNLHS